jgi:hypothetical protein
MPSEYRIPEFQRCRFCFRESEEGVSPIAMYKGRSKTGKMFRIWYIPVSELTR